MVLPRTMSKPIYHLNGLKKLPNPNRGNVAILLMHSSSCEIAKTQLVKILQLWLKSGMDDVDERNYQLKIGEMWKYS